MIDLMRKCVFCLKMENIPVRLNLGVMIFVLSFLNFTMNVSLSIAIIAMTESKNDTAIQSDDEVLVHGPLFQWSNFEQNTILGAYFYGNLLPSIVGGVLAEKYGGRTLIGYSFFLSALTSACIPFVANNDFRYIFFARFLSGFFGGFLYPSCHQLISKWSPPDEKGKFFSALMGSSFGMVITLQTAALLIEKYGWQFAFYFPATLSLLMSFLWFYLTSDLPESHPRISQKELEYIEKSLGENISKQSKIWPPLGQVFTSLPFIGLLCLHYGSSWGYFFLQTQAPKFMKEAFGFSLSQAGAFASLPYLCRFLLGFAFGSIGDFIRSKDMMSVTTTRKSFTIFSHFIPAFLLVLICFIGGNATIFITLLTIGFGLNGAVTVSTTPNFHDIGPNYAGALYGIVDFVGLTSGFVAPILVSYFTEFDNTLEEWRYLFLITAGIYSITAIIFCIVGSGKVQKWNNNLITKKDLSSS